MAEGGSGVMDDQLNVPLEDAELLAEVELTTNLIIAASESDDLAPAGRGRPPARPRRRPTTAGCSPIPAPEGSQQRLTPHLSCVSRPGWP